MKKLILFFLIFALLLPSCAGETPAAPPRWFNAQYSCFLGSAAYVSNLLFVTAYTPEGIREGLCREYGKEIYPPAVYEQTRGFFSDLAKKVTDEELERFLILAKSITTFDVSDELAKIECPVLAVGAYEDPVLDDDATMEIAVNLDHRQDFELYMYVGYGHAAFDTAPDYRKRVYDFLMKE